MAKKQTEKKESKGSKPELPFARAQIDRILKKHCKNQEISPRFKIAFNMWLGEMVENVSKELAKVPHKTITEQDLKNVIGKYEFAGDLKKERERISGKMKELHKNVEKFKEEVEKSIIHKEEGPQDLIYGRVSDQFKQDYEEAVYVSEPAPEIETEPEAGVEPEAEAGQE